MAPYQHPIDLSASMIARGTDPLFGVLIIPDASQVKKGGV